MSENYEALLCASFLSSPELIESVTVEPKVFADGRYRTLYEVMWALKDSVVSPGTLCQELQNRQWGETDAIKLVSTLIGVYPESPGVDTAEALAKKVNDAYGKRSLSKKIAVLLKDTRDPATGFADNVAKLGTVAIEAQMGMVNVVDPSALGIYTRILDRKDSGVPVVFPSGFSLIDQRLGSQGVKKGQVWFVVGPYKAYKTRVVVHMCNAALDAGRNVSYFGLEDDDITFSTALMASRFGIPEAAFEAYYDNKNTPRKPDICNALEWLVSMDTRWVVHDQRSGAGDWKRFASMVMADRIKYNTDLVVIDHLQAWSEDYKVLGEISPMLMAVAGQSQVAMVVLSQMSNETMKMGAATSLLATKGSGSFGALAHVGIEVLKDHEMSDFSLSAYPEVRAKLEVDGMLPFVNKSGEVAEVVLKLKIVRKGQSGKAFYGLFDVYSGKLLAMYERPYVLK